MLIPMVVSFKYSYVVQIGVLAALAVSAFARYSGPLRQDKTFTSVPVLAFVAIAGLSFRGGDSLKMALLFAGVLAVLFFLKHSITRQSAYESIFTGMVLYVSANVLGWLAGLKAPGASARIGGYETSSGFFAKRVFFPFQTNLNESAYIAAAVLVAAVALLKIGRRPRWFQWTGVIAAPIILIGSNTRGAIIFTPLVALAVWLVPNAFRVVAPYAVGLLLTLPLYYSYIVGFLAAFGRLFSFANPAFARESGGVSALEFEGRTTLWAAAMNFWSENFPGLSKFLFGYGYPGQFNSGLTYYFPRAWGEFTRDRRFLTTHNSVLQLSFDAGLIGATILLVVLGMVLFRYAQTVQLLPMLVITTMLALAGVFESSLTLGIGQVTVFLLICLAFFTPGSRSVDVPDRPPQSFPLER